MRPLRLLAATTLLCLLLTAVAAAQYALVNQPQEAGTHEVTFDAAGLPSGVYFYRLQTGAASITRRMILLR